MRDADLFDPRASFERHQRIAASVFDFCGGIVVGLVVLALMALLGP